MSEHYGSNIIEANAWCNKCSRHTPHRVDAPKLGPCLLCLQNLEEDNAAKRRAQELAQHQQPGLFSDDSF